MLKNLARSKPNQKKELHLSSGKADFFDHYGGSITDNLGSLITVFYLTGINECNDPTLSGCNQNCTDTLTSFYCSCNPGYKLLSDKRTCVDIDECKETPFICSQKCENLPGTYICKCAPGYIREPDGKTCRQNSNIEPDLIFSNRYYLRNLTIYDNLYSLILQGLGNVVALDFDRVEKRLYWLDIENKVIERMFVNKTNRETVLKHNLPGAESLAVDWVTR